MRTLIRWAVWLYPASWQARYGDELDALLEDLEPGWPEFFDVCRGAIKMQLLRGNPIRFVATCALAGVLIAGWLAWRAPDEYRSVAVLRLPQGSDPEQLNHAEQAVLSRRTLADVIQKYGLYPEERKSEPLEDIVAAMRSRSVQVRVLEPQANAIMLAFNDHDPARAQAVAKDLTSRFTAATNLQVLDPPSLPSGSISPNRLAWLGAGLLLGSVAAVLILGIRRWPLVPLVGIGTMLLVWPATYLIPDQYRSSAAVRSASCDVGNEAFLELLINENRLYAKERATMPIGSVAATMKRNLLVKRIDSPRASVCLIQFEYPDRYKAAATLRDIVAKIEATHADAQVLDPASFPEKAYTPNRLVLVMGALFAGLVLGTVMLNVRRHRTPALAG